MSGRDESTPLPDAYARSVLGLAALVLTTAMLKRRTVGTREARIFRSVNQLPDRLFVPLWLVMQLGTLGAAPAAAAVARAAGRRRLATGLLLGGAGTWALSKAVKHAVGRPRPGVVDPETRVRGREATGLGYLSGHAGVALALAARQHGPSCRIRHGLRRWCSYRPSACRECTSAAHLPLDVVGGFALGFTVEAVLELALTSREE